MITPQEWTPESNRVLQERMWAEQDERWIGLVAKSGAKTKRDRERVLHHLFSGTHTTPVYKNGIAGPELSVKFLNFDKFCPLCRLYLEHDGEAVLLQPAGWTKVGG